MNIIIMCVSDTLQNVNDNRKLTNVWEWCLSTLSHVVQTKDFFDNLDMNVFMCGKCIIDCTEAYLDSRTHRIQSLGVRFVNVCKVSRDTGYYNVVITAQCDLFFYQTIVWENSFDCINFLTSNSNEFEWDLLLWCEIIR